MTSALRLFFIGLIAFALTAAVAVISHTVISSFADCYFRNTCQSTPITGTIGFGLDALSQVLYFAFFPIGALLARRDFRKTFSNRTIRRVARWAFAFIPVILFPFKYYLFS